MKHIMTKIVKEIIAQKEKELQKRLNEACKNDDSHTRNLAQ